MKNNKILIGVLAVLVVIFVIVLILFLNKPSYDVQFVSDGMTINTVKVKRKDRVERPSNPTKDGYVFVDWYLNGDKFDFSTLITENIILTAVWNIEEVEENEFVITFNTDGGNILLPQKVQENEKIAKPEDPVKEGYKFLGWFYKVNDEEKEFDFETLITENVELYAKWQVIETPKSSSSTKSSAKSYTVTFNTDGGSKVASQTVKENDKVKKPSDPTKSGYKFREWRLNNVPYDFNSKVTKNITLVAIWTDTTVKVTSVQLSDSSLNLTVGENKTLKAVVNPSNATDNTVSWISSNTKVATVNSNGKVTAIGAGTATITAKAGDKSATCKVTVVQAAPASSNPPASSQPPASSEPPASSSEPPASSSEPEQPIFTYSLTFVQVPGDQLSRSRAYIKRSDNVYVSGVVLICSIEGECDSYSVDAQNGSNELFVLTAIDLQNSRVESYS